MFLHNFDINSSSLVSEIVAQDYRTADVFRKYGIEYCCGGKWPLSTVCQMKGIDEQVLKDELRRAMRTFQVSANLPFEKWSVDFLTDYIVNVHHYYLDNNLPAIKELLDEFVTGHADRYHYLPTLKTCFTQLHDEMLPHMRHEEEVIFPYIRQVAHAFHDEDTFGTLLVRTLRKPIGKMIDQEHSFLAHCIYKFRELTNNYTPPEKSCTNHRVVFSRLKELDYDMVQHMYLESDLLFPRVIEMEKKLLETKD
jgi:regulator of cell morphogenesis and NO signaling